MFGIIFVPGTINKRCLAKHLFHTVGNFKEFQLIFQCFCHCPPPLVAIKQLFFGFVESLYLGVENVHNLSKETKKLEVASRPTKCKHYYLYYNDFEFGWMFIKIQTWFPYSAQIYINDREYLSKLFDKNGVRYVMYHNSFSYVEDFEKAQELADGIHRYYWCVDQTAYPKPQDPKNAKPKNRLPNLILCLKIRNLGKVFGNLGQIA